MSAVDGNGQENVTKCVQRSHSLILSNSEQWFIANGRSFHRVDHIRSNHSMKSVVLENYTKSRPNVCFCKFRFEFNVSSHYKEDNINFAEIKCFFPTLDCMMASERKTVCCRMELFIEHKVTFFSMGTAPWFFFVRRAKIKSVLPTVEAISFLFACVGDASRWEIPKSKNKLYALHI